MTLFELALVILKFLVLITYQMYLGYFLDICIHKWTMFEKICWPNVLKKEMEVQGSFALKNWNFSDFVNPLPEWT